MAKNNNPGFFYGLYSDKPWVFDQSEGEDFKTDHKFLSGNQTF